MTKPDTRKQPDHKALGKGLHALLPARNAAAAAPAPIPPAVAEGGVSQIPLTQVRPNPNQPRREFDEQAMLELAQSVERDGIIQPIVARAIGPQDYEIIAGERRWRAATMAGLATVPVIIREAGDQKVLELAIVENIQREDLNPIELAVAFERMTTELGLSHEEIGQKTGKDRATVTNSIRLLQLPLSVRELVSSRKLTAGHARALLKLPSEKTQREIADRCVAEGWSVRLIEDFTRPAKEPGDEIVARKPDPRPIDPNVRAAIGQLERALGTRVRIMEKKKGKGTIEIEYYSEEDLDRIYSLIAGPAHSDPAML